MRTSARLHCRAQLPCRPKACCRRNRFRSALPRRRDQGPQDPNIPAAHVETLAGLDFSGEAAEVAANASKRFPNEPHFSLLEAVNAGAAGEWDRADAIFAKLALNSPCGRLKRRAIVSAPAICPVPKPCSKMRLSRHHSILQHGPCGGSSGECRAMSATNG